MLLQLRGACRSGTTSQAAAGSESVANAGKCWLAGVRLIIPTVIIPNAFEAIHNARSVTPTVSPLIQVVPCYALTSASALDRRLGSAPRSVITCDCGCPYRPSGFASTPDWSGGNAESTASILDVLCALRHLFGTKTLSASNRPFGEKARTLCSGTSMYGHV